MQLTQKQNDLLLKGFFESHTLKEWLFSTERDQELLKEHIDYYVDIYGVNKLADKLNSTSNESLLDEMVYQFYLALEDGILEDDFYENQFDWMKRLQEAFPEEFEDAGYDMNDFLYEQIDIRKFHSWDDVQKEANKRKAN